MKAAAGLYERFVSPIASALEGDRKLLNEMYARGDAADLKCIVGSEETDETPPHD